MLYGGGMGVLAGWATLGMLVAFIQYTERAFQPVLRLSQQYNAVQIALGAAERIYNMLNTEVAAADSGRDRNLFDERGEGFTALGVGRSLLVLDRMPLRMSRHSVEIVAWSLSIVEDEGRLLVVADLVLGDFVLDLVHEPGPLLFERQARLEQG